MGSIPAGETYAVIPLQNVKSDREGNEVSTALRNVLSRARIYYVSSQHAVTIRGAQADVEAARAMLAALDKPQPAYRLTYVITEKDGGKTTRTRRYEMALDASGRAEMKQGSRIPIVTGAADGQSGAKSNVQYLDVSLTISAELDGARLHSKVAETRLSDSKSGMATGDPVLDQTVLNGDTPLATGRPLLLGSVAVPNSTRVEVVEVTADPVE
ncbi:MAG TPA: secretin N-terminal domain-containing protein [Terracidiphilus sp.]|nr:secretin N-terminal domain-containing protein [Terracidiphilus sp.]